MKWKEDYMKNKKKIIEHFLKCVNRQIKDPLVRAFGTEAEYQLNDLGNRIMSPDASINCNIRKRIDGKYTAVPRMVFDIIDDQNFTDKFKEKKEQYK